MASNEYPKFICRAGTHELARGVWIEAGRAEDADDLAAKLADGWVRTPEEIDQGGDPAPAPSVRAKPGRKPKPKDA